MPVYVGGRKAKELYFGGRKIKEAWLNGKKVYSSGGRIFGKWYRDFDYVVGDRVAEGGFMYECIKSHTSDPGSNQPGFGWNQYEYWKQIGYAADFDF